MNTHHPDRLTDAAGVRVLLYGDVDLNVIDGSATWLPSLAETLARTGASVDVQLKAVERRDLLTAPLRALTGVRVLPAEPAAGQGGMTPSRAADVLARRDEESRYDVVLVRGIHACLELADRGAFPGRLWSYVTEYGYVEDGFPAGRVEELGRIAAASRLMLAQTPQARAVLEAMVPAAAGRTELLSPMVPDGLVPAERAEAPADGPVRLVYTGKFAHDWRTDLMPDVLTALHEAGVPATLTMVGDKVHPERDRPGWAAVMRSRLEADRPYFEWTGALSREESMARTAAADVSLGWRAPALDLSLEISTKVLESCAVGVPPLLNRTVAHEELLGADYPLFVDGVRDSARDVAARIAAARHDLPALSRRVVEAAAPYRMAARARALTGVMDRLGLLDRRPARGGSRTRVVLAGHDLKFAGELVDLLRDDSGVELRIDHWQGLHRHDEAASRRLVEWADVVVCEWAGPNAVWYARHKRPGQRLVVRLHMFELRGGWLSALETDAVDRLVTVSDLYRDLVREHLPIEPTRVTVIPNAVSVADLDRPGLPGRRFRLGLVGVVPLRKRLDRAVDLLEILRAHDERFTLHVRGRMPWEYPHEWRKPLQREGYLDLFARLGAGPLREAVAFEPFGADMGSWLTKIGWVLSPSTTESFHLAPAEGMVSGAVPLVWDRPGARGVFGEEFVLDDTDAAARRVLEATADDARWDALSALARDRVRSYDERVVASLWREALGLN